MEDNNMNRKNIYAQIILLFGSVDPKPGGTIYDMPDRKRFQFEGNVPMPRTEEEAYKVSKELIEKLAKDIFNCQFREKNADD